MKNLLQDLRFALRQMRRSPGFAVTAVLTLALGIAANVIVFCILQTFILQPIDVPHAQQVVTLARTDQTYPIFSVPEVNDVGKANTVFSGLAPYTIASFGLEADGVSRPIWGSEVGGQYFELLGVRPMLGRLLSRADDQHPGASTVAVLTWPTWNDRFRSDPDIVGKTVRINKMPYTVVGVTPQGFYGTEKIAEPGLFLPLANEASLSGFDFLNARSAHTVWAIARLKAGMTRPQAEAQLKTIAAGIARQYPHEEETLGLKLTRPGLMGDFLGSPVRGFLYGLMGLAGIVLLAACANLGSLFAARTADRTRGDRDTHGHRVRPLAYRSPDFGGSLGHRAAGRRVRQCPGVAGAHRAGKLAPTDRLPAAFPSAAATLHAGHQSAHLPVRRRGVRGDAAKTNFSGRCQRGH